jgi:uncharacterized membrane protein/protein-disulfide isomerase
MSGHPKPSSRTIEVTPEPARRSVRWLVIAAIAGLGFSAASTWVHSRILHDPFYSSSICDISATFSCTQAYTSRFGSVAGIPIALVGVLYFTAILVMIVLCQRSTTARQNIYGYVFALSTLGLAGVLYLGYASFFVLKTICVLCAGTYAAVIALFVISGAAERSPMTSLPRRASRDMATLIRTPAALASALSFIAAAIVAVTMFPGSAVSASVPANENAQAGGNSPATSVPPPQQQLTPDQLRELDQFLGAQQRVQIPGTAGSGAAVTIVKFNDYQCPPCGITYREYKPVLARLQQEHPGKITFVTKDFPLDQECNSLQGVGFLHPSACEAAAAVRMARQRGRADSMEEWLFANQPALTPEGVKQAVSTVAGVTDFDAHYGEVLNAVRGEIAQGLQLGVRGTPTFFLNGIRLPIWPAYVFQAAIESELRRASTK